MSLQRLGLIRAERHEGTGLCLAWLLLRNVCPGLLSSPWAGTDWAPLLSSVFLWTSQLYHSQTEFVYKMSRVHCCSPLNSPRKCIWEQALTGCYSNMVWLSSQTNMAKAGQKHKAQSWYSNPERQFILPGSSYKPDPQIKNKQNSLSSVFVDTIWALWLYLDVKPTSYDWCPKFLLSPSQHSLFRHRIQV